MDSSLEEKWLQTANGRICYFANNSFTGRPTIVFLHGLSSNHTTWLRAEPVLKELKVNYLMPDLRGHGYSDKTKRRSLYRYSVFTEDLKKIIQKENLSKVILVGYSFGGFIALDYAIKYPSSLAALVLISANHVNPFIYRKINFLTWPTYYLISFLALLFFWQRRKKYHYFNQETERGYWSSTFKGFTTMPVSINLWMLSETANLDFRQGIEKISCPTLIVKSSKDPFLSAREAEDMHRKIKDSEVFILDSPTHFLASRYGEEVVGSIINFLKRKKII
jgi:pimeloyl-ACP methyl ester carboxylesterase